MDSYLSPGAVSVSGATLFASSRALVLFDHFRIPYEVDGELGQGGCVELRVPGGGRRLLWPAGFAGRLSASTVAGADGETRVPVFARVLPDGEAEVLLAGLGDGWRRLASVTALGGGELGSIWRHEDGSVFVPFDPDEVIFNYWSEGYTAAYGGWIDSLRRRLMTGYYRVRPWLPRALQIWMRRGFARIQARAGFPAWPVETGLHDFCELMLAIVASIADEPIPSISPWPDGRSWALVLTHDVEFGAGWDARRQVLDLERAHGVRSSWNLVPRRYEVDLEAVQELVADGFEVGVHGLYHDGRDLASLDVWSTRLPAIREAAERWGARGFRAPALHRRWAWMSMPGLEYDSSCPDTDPFEPQPGGCCTWLPFFNGETVELPITMAQDHTLFVILRRDCETVWEDKARFLRERGGMALIDTHPDYLREEAIFGAYGRFLEQFASDPTAWTALPGDVARWWRRRANSQLERDGDGWKVVGPASLEARVEYVGGGWAGASEEMQTRAAMTGGRAERVTMLLENNPYPQDIRVRQEAESLVAAGHSVEVIAPRGIGQPARERVNGVEVRRFRAFDPSRQNALSVIREYLVAVIALHLAAIRALLRGSTVLHLHNPPDVLFPAGALFRLAGRRVVFDHHDLGPELAKVRFGRDLLVRIARLSERLTFAVASHVLAANASHAEIALERGGKGAQDVTVVRNGPRRAWTHVPIKVRPGRLETLRLAYLGTIADQDGLEEMAEVLAILRDTVPELKVTLTVVGDGDGRSEFEDAVARRGVADQVSITGWVPLEQVPSLLADADICVDPAPATELNVRSTMIKVAEYLALGKPVVAYDLLETRRTVNDAAVLVTPGDTAGFAHELALLADDGARRARMAQRARERAMALTWDKSESALLAAYAGFSARREQGR
jgi:glycosyltransferase involved in cell wall biosynthesis